MQVCFELFLSHTQHYNKATNPSLSQNVWYSNEANDGLSRSFNVYINIVQTQNRAGSTDHYEYQMLWKGTRRVSQLFAHLTPALRGRSGLLSNILCQPIRGHGTTYSLNCYIDTAVCPK